MARKLCLVSIIILGFTLGNFKAAAAKVSLNRKNQVTVTAEVLEQIAYERNTQRVSVGTNYEKGAWLILENAQKHNLGKEIKLSVPSDEKIVVVAKI